VFGIESPDEQKADYTAIIDAINAEGGIACRKVVAQFFEANPADQNNLHATCLAVGESGAFAVIDPGSYTSPTAPGGPICFASQHIAYFGGYILTQSQADQGFPYLFALGN